MHPPSLIPKPGALGPFKLTNSSLVETPVPVCSFGAGGSVRSSSTVIAQILPKNCGGESSRVTVKWYLARTLPGIYKAIPGTKRVQGWLCKFVNIPQ